jgi:AraC-like DNA-binding protein
MKETAPACVLFPVSGRQYPVQGRKRRTKEFDMPTLPIPIFAALVLGFLGLRAWLRGETPRPLLALIALCALQTAVVAGRLHYGLEALSYLQPVLALAIPPVAWLGFVSATRRPMVTSDLWHLVGPAFGLFCRVAAPWVLDAVIVGVFLAYGAAMLLALRDAGEVAHARLGAGEGPLKLWRWVGVALIASGLTDVLLFVAAFGGYQNWLGWLVTLFSSATLLALGGLMLAEEIGTTAEPETGPGATEDDAALVAAMDVLMQERRLWLDPDLTLARIARRMGVPAKSLSAAINRVRGENVSRVVNGWRITEACRLMREGASVTEAMLASGFNTKSNFNREFLRVMGQPPSDWLKAGVGA